MELEWNDLSVLLAVCRAGSLSGAARALGHNHSTIFRKVNAIEERTGVRFFERLAAGYAMTDAGRTALDYAERIESEVHALSREILGQDTRLSGRVVLTAMEGLATARLPSLIAGFRKQHPDVVVDVIGATAASDLGRREADLAVRAARRPPDVSLARRVCDFRFALYASPDYLASRPRTPLPEHDFCLLHGVVEWFVPMIWKTKELGRQRSVYTADSVFAVIQAAAEGMGVAALPCYMGDADARLVRASRFLEPLTLRLWVLTHTDLRHTARVKALAEHLHAALSADADLFEGKRPQRKSKRFLELPG